MRARTHHPIRRSVVAVAAAALVGTAVAASPAAAAEPPRDRSPVDATSLESGQTYDRFIVRYDVADRAARARKVDRAAQRSHRPAKVSRTLATDATLVTTTQRLNPAQARDFMAALADDPAAVYVEPDARMHATLTPNDTSYGSQWHYSEATAGMNLPTAWNTATGTGVTVAVVDTGITTHSDLSGNVVAGYDFISDAATARDGNGRDANPADQGDWYAANECGDPSSSSSSWHGTHVAGTVAAVTNNAKGVAGVAFGAKVSPLRVLGKCGGFLSDIADAIVWASGGAVSGVPANANPAKVVNMSLGGGGTCASTYQNAINSAAGRGTTVVVAAGNENTNASTSQPANCANVVTVAALDRSGNRAFYSNYGTSVDVSAPGGETSPTSSNGILSTLNSGTTTPGSESYAYYQGTSMATPHVAGLAALMLSKKSMTPAEVEATMKANVRAIPGTCTGGCGAGLVDATKTVAAVTGGGGTGGQLFANPGFESGVTGWSQTPGVIDSSTGRPARTGSWKAWLDGYGTSHTDTLSQTVAVPSAAASATLSFWLRVDTAETGSIVYDTLRVQVLNTSGGVLATLATYSNVGATATYGQKSFNLSAYRGQTVTIRFDGTEDSSLQTSFVIDDTALTTT